jgi:soluble lytic murein transglycosylase-like protein
VRSAFMHRRFASLAAVLATVSLAVTATAVAANHPAVPATTPAGGTPAAPPVSSRATPRSLTALDRARPAGCARWFTVAEHRGYAKRVFQRARISRKATRQLSQMRRCQNLGQRGTRAARRTERRLERWRSLYHCTQSRIVNCIRDATRRYGGSFAHNLACARSESGLHPYARNAGGSGATGLYQFMPPTWTRTLARMGVGRRRSIYSAKWQARAAVWKFQHDGFGEWTGAGC